MMANYKCDFCNDNNLDIVYKVPDSSLDMQVAVCTSCGLVQSLAGKDKVEGIRVVTTNSGANWGNIRHGKGLRFKALLPLLEEQLPWPRINRILDVGSNRGSFVRWLTETKTSLEIVGVEPDERVVEDYRALPNLSLHIERFENANLPNDHFDLVYCTHTLEHADSASAMLRQIWNVMVLGGYLLLEVPNIEVLSAPDVLEEFFIDKHRFHFNRELLVTFVEHIGFQVVYGPEADDMFNITLLLRKREPSAKENNLIQDSELGIANVELIQEYVTKLGANRNRLRNIVDTKIHPFIARQKVAFWGASKIFDALVRFGGLEASQVHCLVDEYLWRILPSVHGVTVNRPEYLKIAQPQVVIVLARSSADEIVEKSRGFGVKNIIKITDLLI